MSYDQTPTPATQQPQQAYAPDPYAPEPRSGGSGWLIVLALVVVLALGGLAAAIISRGDEGSASPTTPSGANQDHHGPAEHDDRHDAGPRRHGRAEHHVGPERLPGARSERHADQHRREDGEHAVS